MRVAALAHHIETSIFGLLAGTSNNKETATSFLFLKLFASLRGAKEWNKLPRAQYVCCDNLDFFIITLGVRFVNLLSDIYRSRSLDTW